MGIGLMYLGIVEKWFLSVLYVSTLFICVILLQKIEGDYYSFLFIFQKDVCPRSYVFGYLNFF